MEFAIDSVAKVKERARHLRQYVEAHQGEIGPAAEDIVMYLERMEDALADPDEIDWRKIATAHLVLDKTLGIARVKAIPDWWLDQEWEMRAWLNRFRAGKLVEGERLSRDELELKHRHRLGADARRGA